MIVNIIKFVHIVNFVKRKDLRNGFNKIIGYN